MKKLSNTVKNTASLITKVVASTLPVDRMVVAVTVTTIECTNIGYAR